MTRKEYIRQLAQEIINMNKPMINRIVTAEVDKIKAQLASLAPNAADRRKMLAVMGSNSALACYLKKLMNWLALNLTSPQTHSQRHSRHQIRENISAMRSLIVLPDSTSMGMTRRINVLANTSMAILYSTPLLMSISMVPKNFAIS